ncbi:hypothetical protein CHARACLAT_026168 [Characodon lateralis]|uniref:Uncharacterized protein n=1 Tax=Characodon lateralis TaxID=208331 RepID=A0ABU7DA46_9TELE|nr:hypothetical protein [Characodon lateralis]
MTPSHQLDLLTDALLYYGRRKSTDLEVQLIQRRDKAEKVWSLAEEEIFAVLKEPLMCISERDIQQWMETKIEVAQPAHLKTRPTDTVPRWKRNYVMKLTKFNQLRLESDFQAVERHYGIKQRWCQSDEIFQSTLRDLDQEVRGHLILQAQNEARERVTLLNLKRTYPDGQGIAIRLSKQVNTCNRRLKKIITGYNGLQWPPQTTKFPSHLE